MLDTGRDQAVKVKIVQLLRPPDGQDDAAAQNSEHLLEWNCFEDQAEDHLPFSGRSKALELNVYLGETFSCYTIVSNGTEDTVSDIILSVDLQTNQRRCKIPLSYQEAADKLVANNSLRAIFTHEVTEVGQHMLICTLSYNNSSGARLTSRKLYKFTVLRPLDVHTKFYDSTDELFLEAQVQNVTEDDLIMEHIALEPTEGHFLIKLHSGHAPASNRPIKPGCVCQFMYGLQFRWDNAMSKSNQGLATVGKLSMIWRTTKGRHGRLQTSPLERMITGCGDLKMKMIQAPNAVKIQQPFQVVCRLTNRSERVLQPRVTLEQQAQSGFVWNSKSNQHLGQMNPADSLDLTLVMIPTCTGLKHLTGIQFQDVLTKRTYEPDEVAQFFVYT